MSNGICLFAYNNPEIDYIRLAVVCAAHIKANMENNNVTLITTQGDVDWLEQSHDEDVINTVFDNIVISEPTQRRNVRQHKDSPWTTFNCQFNNSNKHEVFELSPYDKTLMIDIDYLVNNNMLDYLFDTDAPLAMYATAKNIDGNMTSPHEQFINPVGIPMWWSTVVYFDRSESSKMFFDLWAHISDNYEYYGFLYGFPNKLFRTDFCVSVALHILNGMQSGNYAEQICDTFLINSVQQDDIVKVNDDGSILMLVNDTKEPWHNCLSRMEKTNIHVMNKRALLRNADKFMEVLL